MAMTKARLEEGKLGADQLRRHGQYAAADLIEELIAEVERLQAIEDEFHRVWNACNDAALTALRQARTKGHQHRAGG